MDYKKVGHMVEEMKLFKWILMIIAFYDVFVGQFKEDDSSLSGWNIASD